MIIDTLDLQSRCGVLRKALLAKAPSPQYLCYVTFSMAVQDDEVRYRIAANLWLHGQPGVFEYSAHSKNPFDLFKALEREVTAYEHWTPEQVAATLGIGQ